MEVMQIIGIAIISTALCLVIKKDRPEIAMFIGILTGVIILTSVIFKLGFIIESINDLANKANIPSVYITLIIKLIGIAYLMEFAIQLCKDCGEGNIASKLRVWREDNSNDNVIPYTFIHSRNGVKYYPIGE